jgi:hypothetical protein
MQRAAAIALAAGVVVSAVVISVAASAEELGRRVDPSTRQTIRTYRVLDRVTVDISEASTSTLDLANGLLLAAACGIALTAGVLAGSPRLRGFFLWAGFGCGYLALDEVLELNESYELNLDRAGLPADLDLVAYGIATLLFVVLFRDVLLSSTRALLLAGASFLLFVSAQALDALIGRLHGIEEHIEPLASAVAVAALLALAHDVLRAETGRMKGAEGHEPAASSQPPAATGERERGNPPRRARG